MRPMPVSVQDASVDAVLLGKSSLRDCCFCMRSASRPQMLKCWDRESSFSKKKTDHYFKATPIVEEVRGRTVTPDLLIRCPQPTGVCRVGADSTYLHTLASRILAQAFTQCPSRALKVPIQSKSDATLSLAT